MEGEVVLARYRWLACRLPLLAAGMIGFIAVAIWRHFHGSVPAMMAVDPDAPVFIAVAALAVPVLLAAEVSGWFWYARTGAAAFVIQQGRFMRRTPFARSEAMTDIETAFATGPRPFEVLHLRFKDGRERQWNTLNMKPGASVLAAEINARLGPPPGS